MGGEVSKKYDVPDTPNASAGHCQLWKIYPVTNKATGEEVSLWTLSKDDLGKRKPIPIADKTLQEQIFQIMKKDLTTLKDLNHGSIIRVVEVIEDSKKSFAFITERVICSLADLLGRFEEIPTRYSWHTPYIEENGTISETEISRGVLNIAEGLQFLHTVQKRLHLSVSPENIVITLGGVWKLCGFGFSLTFANDEVKIAIPYFMNQKNTAVRVDPDLRYCGGEFTEGLAGGGAGAAIRTCTGSADVFSLGLTAYEIYRYNLRFAQQGRSNMPLLQLSSNIASEHAPALNALQTTDYSVIPDNLRQLMTGMMAVSSGSRISPVDVINNPFFHSGPLAVLRSVDNILTRDIGSQAALLAGLPGQLTYFTPRMQETIILPMLCKLTLANPSMWTYALPVHMHIASRITTGSYAKAVTPAFISGLGNKESTETLNAFVKHMDHILDRFDQTFFQTHVVPMLCNAIDKQNANMLQVATISVLVNERVISRIEIDSFLNEIVPRVCRETCKNADIGIKLKGLYFISVSCTRMNRQYLSANILPSLKHVATLPSNPPDVVMAVVGVYNSMLGLIGVDLMSNSVLPVLTALLVEKNINKSQFQLIANRVQHVLQIVLNSRTAEFGLPEISVSRGEPVKGFFFQEENGSKGSGSEVLTPGPPSIPAMPPPVPTMPPSMTGYGSSTLVPPPIPVVAPVAPAIPPKPVSYQTPPPVPPVPPSVPATTASFYQAPPVPTIPPASSMGTSSYQAPPVPPKPSSSSGYQAPPIPPAASSSGYQAPPIPPAASSSGYQAPPIPPPAALTSYKATPPSADIGDMDDFLSSFQKKSQTTAAPPPPVPVSNNSSVESGFSFISTPSAFSSSASASNMGGASSTNSFPQPNQYGAGAAPNLGGGAPGMGGSTSYGYQSSYGTSPSMGGSGPNSFMGAGAGMGQANSGSGYMNQQQMNQQQMNQQQMNQQQMNQQQMNQQQQQQYPQYGGYQQPQAPPQQYNQYNQGVGNFSGGYPQQQQQQQQSPMGFNQQNMMGMHGQGSNMSYQPQVQQQQQTQQRYSSNIGNLPPPTGYQPPIIPPPGQKNNKPVDKNDPFGLF